MHHQVLLMMHPNFTSLCEYIPPTFGISFDLSLVSLVSERMQMLCIAGWFMLVTLKDDDKTL